MSKKGKIGIVVIVVIVAGLVLWAIHLNKPEAPKVTESKQDMTTVVIAELKNEIVDLRAEQKNMRTELDKKPEPQKPIVKVITKTDPKLVEELAAIRKELAKRTEYKGKENDKGKEDDKREEKEPRITDMRIFEVLKENVVVLDSLNMYFSAAKKFFVDKTEGDMCILHDGNGWGVSGEPIADDRLISENGNFKIALSTLKARIPVTKRGELKGRIFNFGFYRGQGQITWAMVHIDKENPNVKILPTGGCIFVSE